MGRGNRKRQSRRRPPLGFQLIILLAIVGGIFYVGLQQTPVAHTLRRWTAVALEPVTWLSTVPQMLDNFGSDLQSRSRILQENSSLKLENLRLSARLLRFQALEAENQRLRRLLSAASRIHHKVLVATIIKASQAPYSYQILINKGIRQGVYRGQAVIDAHGVLGQVVRANPVDSVALLITDPHNGIPVQINRTGLQTVALGRGDGQTLTLPFLPRNADIHAGDLLVSSGMGGRFPEGYPVGRIIAVRRPPGESFMDAIAEPLAHLNRSREVLLVWNATSREGQSQPNLPIDLHKRRSHGGPGHRRYLGSSVASSAHDQRAASPTTAPAHR